MAKKISDLVAATQLGDNDSFVFNDVVAGNDKRVTASSLRADADVVKFASVSELKSVEGKRDGQAAELLGYYSSGDGGGGFVYWDSSSTETANNGTIFQVTGITTGRWKRNKQNIATFNQFGAKGDGINDDTSHVLKAIEELDICLGESKSVYIISDLNYLGEGKSKTIIGDGCEFKLKPNTSTKLITFSKLENLSINSVNLNGNKANQTTNASSPNALFDKVQNLSLENFHSYDSIYHGGWIFKCKKINVNKSRFYDNGVADNAFPADGLNVLASQGSITDSYFYSNNTATGGDNIDGDGLQFSTGGSTEAGYWDPAVDLKNKITVRGNFCYDNGRRGIKIQRDNVDVKGNFVYGNYNDITITQGTQNILNTIVENNELGKDGLESRGAVIVSMGGGYKAINVSVKSNNNYSNVTNNDAYRLEDVQEFEAYNNQNYGTVDDVYNDIAVRGASTNGSIYYIKGQSIVNKAADSSVVFNSIQENIDSYTKLYKLEYNQDEWGKRFDLPHNTLTELFDVTLTDRNGYGLIIEYQLIDTDANFIPTNSGTKYSLVGQAVINVNFDSGGVLRSAVNTLQADAGDSATTLNFSIVKKDAVTTTIQATVSNGASRNMVMSASIRLLRYSNIGSFSSKISLFY